MNFSHSQTHSDSPGHSVYSGHPVRFVRFIRICKNYTELNRTSIRFGSVRTSVYSVRLHAKNLIPN